MGGTPLPFCVCKSLGLMDDGEEFESGSDPFRLLESKSRGSADPNHNGDFTDLEDFSFDTSETVCADSFVFPQHREVVGRLSDNLILSKPKFMWEEGFLGAVFGDQRSSMEFCANFSVPSLKRPPTTHAAIQVMDNAMHTSRASNLKPRIAKHLYLKALKRSSVGDDAGKRKSVIEGWTSVICLALEAFKVGKDLIKRRRAFNRVDLVEAVTDCVGTKGTSTITKR